MATKAPAKDEDIHTSIYLPASLLSRIDDWAENHSKEKDGIRVTRKDAIRILVTRSLEVAK